MSVIKPGESGVKRLSFSFEKLPTSSASWPSLFQSATSMPIPVVVRPGARRTPLPRQAAIYFGACDARPDGHVLERAVTLVSEEVVSTEARHVDVVPPVVIEVAHANALPVAVDPQPRPRR